MGSSATKFYQSVKSGDEVSSLKLWSKQPMTGPAKPYPLLSGFPNGEDGNTALHYAAIHVMSRMMPVLLEAANNGGVMLNANKEQRTCLHLLCDVAEGTALQSRGFTRLLFHQAPAQQQEDADSRRAMLIRTLLERCKALGVDTEQIMSAADANKATPLHLVASNGLMQCTAQLLDYGANVFARNGAGLTPCDVAMQNRHTDLALLLSSKMVFSHGPEGSDRLSVEDYQELENLRLDCKGLKVPEIVAMKDRMLIEAADALRVPLYAAAVLLKSADWRHDDLLRSWAADPAAMLSKANLPLTFLTQQGADYALDLHAVESTVSDRNADEAQQECGICLMPMEATSDHAVPCGHFFCMDCWKQYLGGKIELGESHNIACPGVSCDVAVPPEFVDRLMITESRQRYLDFDVKAFVAENANIQWCPAPGCERAVQVTSTPPGDFKSILADCGQCHLSCWSCLEAAHEPCTCDMMKKWRTVAATVGDNVAEKKQERDRAANTLWLAGNSKPCPKCSVPIERSTGCNHMMCQKCRHEFCWMCRGEWKSLHSDATGGYFRCYRKEAQDFESQADKDIAEARGASKQAAHTALLVECSQNVTEHERSLESHKLMLSESDRRAKQLVSAVQQCKNGKGMESSFLKEIAHELAIARSVLSASCIYGYFLIQDNAEKHRGRMPMKVTVYQGLQEALQHSVEDLHQMVSAKLIQTSQPAMVKQALLVRSRRAELIQTVRNGIVPPGIEDDIEREERRQEEERQRRRSNRRRLGPHYDFLLRTLSMEDDDDDDDDRDTGFEMPEDDDDRDLHLLRTLLQRHRSADEPDARRRANFDNEFEAALPALGLTAGAEARLNNMGDPHRPRDGQNVRGGGWRRLDRETERTRRGFNNPYVRHDRLNRIDDASADTHSNQILSVPRTRRGSRRRVSFGLEPEWPHPVQRLPSSDAPQLAPGEELTSDAIARHNAVFATPSSPPRRHSTSSCRSLPSRRPSVQRRLTGRMPGDNDSHATAAEGNPSSPTTLAWSSDHHTEPLSPFHVPFFSEEPAFGACASTNVLPPPPPAWAALPLQQRWPLGGHAGTPSPPTPRPASPVPDAAWSRPNQSNSDLDANNDADADLEWAIALSLAETVTPHTPNSNNYDAAASDV